MIRTLLMITFWAVAAPLAALGATKLAASRVSPATEPQAVIVLDPRTYATELVIVAV